MLDQTTFIFVAQNLAATAVRRLIGFARSLGCSAEYIQDLHELKSQRKGRIIILLDHAIALDPSLTTTQYEVYYCPLSSCVGSLAAASSPLHSCINSEQTLVEIPQANRILRVLLRAPLSGWGATTFDLDQTDINELKRAYPLGDVWQHIERAITTACSTKTRIEMDGKTININLNNVQLLPDLSRFSANLVCATYEGSWQIFASWNIQSTGQCTIVVSRHEALSKMEKAS